MTPDLRPSAHLRRSEHIVPVINPPRVLIKRIRLRCCPLRRLALPGCHRSHPPLPPLSQAQTSRKNTQQNMRRTILRRVPSSTYEIVRSRIGGLHCKTMDLGVNLDIGEMETPKAWRIRVFLLFCCSLIL